MTHAARQGRSNRRRGYSLAEGLLGLTILAGVIAGGVRTVNQGIVAQQARGVATRWALMSKAADDYVKSQGTLLQGVLTSNPSRVIAIPMTLADFATVPKTPSGGTTNGYLPSLQEAGLLGANFKDSNLNSQKTALLAFLPPGTTDTSRFEVFLAGYGGRPMSDDVLAKAEGMSDARVGALMVNDPAGAGTQAIRGARGGWTIAPTLLSGGGSVVPITSGHLFSYMSLTRAPSQTGGNAYLMRNPDGVGGYEGNTMRTDIRMANSGIDGVSHLCGALADGSSANTDVDCSAVLASGVKRVIQVGGDVKSNGGIFAAGAIASGQGVTAPAFYSGDTSGASYDASDPAKSYVVIPNGQTVLNNVTVRGTLKVEPATGKDGTTTAGLLNVAPENLVFLAGTQSSARKELAGKSLSSMIPSQVIKGSYYAGNTDLVPKPAGCATPSDSATNPFSRARIFASLQNVFNESSSNVTSTPNLSTATSLPPYISDITPSGSVAGGISFKITKESFPTPIVTGLTIQNAIAPGEFWTTVTVINQNDAGTILEGTPAAQDQTQPKWQIFIRSYTVVMTSQTVNGQVVVVPVIQQVNDNDVAAQTAGYQTRNKVIAETSCFYE